MVLVEKVGKVELYLRIVCRIGRIGINLKDLENWISSEFNVSFPMARYYIRRLKEEGLIRYKRPYRSSKKIRVEPTGKLLKILADLQERYYL